MQLSEVIRRVIELSQVARQESLEWNAKHTVYHSFVDDQGREVRSGYIPGSASLDDPRPPGAHEALLEFLLGQPAAVGYALAVLTLVARGDGKITDFRKMYDRQSRMHERPDFAVRYVVSIGYLPEYLEWSLALCAAAKVDVDKLLSMVGPRKGGPSPNGDAACVNRVEDRIVTFSEAVKGVIERARAERDEHKERATRGLTRIRLPDEDGVPTYFEFEKGAAFNWMRRPRLARRELNRFLLSLPVTYIYTLAAVMRVARDGLHAATFVQQFDVVRRTYARPQEALQGMLGKRRLARDLEAGLTELSNAGIALDSLV